MVRNLAIVLAFIIIIGSVLAQRICENCWADTVPTSFQCLEYCEAYRIDPSGYYTSCPSIIVKNMYYSSYEYIRDQARQLCVACNYTMPMCVSCSLPNYCSNCQKGYYEYYYDLPKDDRDCQSCNTNIPGCEDCNIQGKCNQCSKEYRLISGLCYNQDGSIVNPGDASIRNHWSAPQVVLVVFIIIITLIMGILLAFKIKQKLFKGKRQSLLQKEGSDPAYS